MNGALGRWIAVAIVVTSIGGVRADTIHFVNARRPLTDVTVLDEKLDVVEYRLNGIQQKQSVDSSEVASIGYDEPPSNVRQALAALDSAATREDVLQAAQQLLGVVPSVKKRALSAQLTMTVAEALTRGGDLDQALAQFERIASETPATRYAPLALSAKGRWLAFRGDAEAARAAFTKLTEYGGPYVIESQVQRAILDESTQAAASLALYERVATEYESKRPELAQLARVRRGRVETALGKRDAALATFRALVAERAALPPALQAAMWNGYGAALTAGGSVASEDQQEALYAHLRVVTMFESIVAEQPEALYRAGKCFLVVTSDDSATRAQHLFKRCQREYPQNEWGKRAAQG